jgi:hypothetical protein
MKEMRRRTETRKRSDGTTRKRRDERKENRKKGEMN